MSNITELFTPLRISLCLVSGFTSRLWREFAHPLSLLQRFALISPFEGFSHRAIEVIDEVKDAGF